MKKSVVIFMSKYLRKNPIRHGLSKYTINKKGAACFAVYGLIVFAVSAWHSLFYGSVFWDDVKFLAEILFPATLCVSVIKSNGLKFEQIPEHGTHNVERIFVGKDIVAAYAIGAILSGIAAKAGFSFWACTNLFFIVSVLILNWCLEMIAGWQDLAEYAQAVNLMTGKCFYIDKINRYTNSAEDFTHTLDSIVDRLSNQNGLKLWYLYDIPKNKQFETREKLKEMWDKAEESPKTWTLEKSYFD